MDDIDSIRQRALLECGQSSLRHVEITHFDTRSLMSLNKLERVVSDTSRLKPDLLWIALSGPPILAINNRERRRAWNVAQLVM